MASLRSHFRHGRVDSEPDSQRKPSSRIPTKTSDTGSKREAVPHVSKLAKRASRSVGSSARDECGTRTSTRESTTLSAARNTSVAPTRPPAVPPPASSRPANEMLIPPAQRHHPLPPPPAIRTPSLVSGSSASTFDSPQSAGLRRKPSTIDKYAAQKRADTASVVHDRGTMHSRNEAYHEALDDSVFGIALPPTSTGVVGRPSERAREWNAKRDRTPSTPSSRYTESPFSHVPTPSSVSSYSPAVVTTSGLPPAPRPRTRSPPRSRPSAAGRSTTKGDASRLGLPSVRESSTSSSNSTVKQSLYKTVPARKQVPSKTSSASPTAAVESVRTPPSPDRSSKRSSIQLKPAAPTAKPPVHIPPELAHLNVDPPTKPSLEKALPPLRPSRVNTPSISDVTRPSPMVQSDLPRLYTTYHKRTPSQETPVSPSAPSPSFRSRFGISSRNSSKQASPRVDSAISPPPSARAFARGPTTDQVVLEPRQLSRGDSPALGPSPSPSKSPRFGFFHRKPKADVSTAIEKPRRQLTKGPAAGTGHEGYGRFGFRGRGGSTASSAGWRSPSADSNTSSVAPTTANRKGSLVSSKDGSELDDFLRERLTPVVLRGSASTMSNPPSSSDVLRSSTIAPSSSSSLDSYPTPELLPSAMHDNRGTSPAKRPHFRNRMPSDSSEDDIVARYPTPAARTSSNRLTRVESRGAISAPAPINTSIPPKSHSIDSYKTKISPWLPTDGATLSSGDLSATNEARWLRREQPEAVGKPPRKWNFFQRAQASPRPKGKQRAVDPEQMPVSSAHETPARNVAHYAMLDPVEPVDLHEVERIMQDNETSAEESMSEYQSPPKMVPYERRHTSLLPSPPRAEFTSDADFRAKPTLPRIVVREDSNELPQLLRAERAAPQSTPHVVDIPESPVAPADKQPQTQGPPQSTTTPQMHQGGFNNSANINGNDSHRQPRLSPVGRIPRVVSKRDRDRKLPDNSFSRPFARAQPHPSVKPPGALYNQIRASRELTSPTDPGSHPVSSTSTRSEPMSAEPKSSITTEPPSVSTNRTSMDMQASNDFMAFTPRKGSEVSFSSSSGNGGWIASLVTAAPQMDDPWLEYNDLLDDMMSQRTPLSTGSSLGAPFQYAGVLQDAHSPGALPSALYYRPPPSGALPPPPRSHTVPAVLGVPQQISDFTRPSLSPLSPHTLSDFVDQYASENTSTLVSPHRASLPLPARNSISTAQQHRASTSDPRLSASSSRYSRGSAHSRSASVPEADARNPRTSLTPSAHFKRDTQLLDIAENDEDEQTRVANLRFGALMTSKWLSFGRVLFSPAHNEMRLADRPKVLVIDGLGSDWSYYVALSYPAATVYNLGPAATDSSTAWPGINQKPPPNHRHIAHSAITAAFPFPQGFFTAVVFRFPLATTDQGYHACVFECKRVLRPGGYLEVTVLDLDLMNMGSRARSVVRNMKTRMQMYDPHVSLRNLSDVLLRLIGKRGFEEVQRCVVGVPAAGRIPRSQDMSSISSGNADNKPSRPDVGRTSMYKEFSFTDLLEGARGPELEPGKGNDENITKMVAKVGRWWYSTCYESPLLLNDKSIWEDHALLRECEKQGTSFRLLICYAQKPIQTRRRTASV